MISSELIYVLVHDRLNGAVRDQLRNGGIDRIEQLNVALGHSDGILLFCLFIPC